MSNRGESGCCGGRGERKSDEAATTTRQEKGGCGCKGEEHKAEKASTEAVVAAANTEPTKTERRQGCC